MNLSQELQNSIQQNQELHATVKPKKWWQEKLNKVNKFVVVRYS